MSAPSNALWVLCLKIVAWHRVHSPPRQHQTGCGQKISQRVGILAGMEFRSSVSPRGATHVIQWQDAPSGYSDCFSCHLKIYSDPASADIDQASLSQWQRFFAAEPERNSFSLVMTLSR